MSPSTSHVAKKIELLVWFEICELAPSGEYVPCAVTHGDNLPCRGVFILHQGLQRRIRVTIVHESDEDVRWRDVREVLVGRFHGNKVKGSFPRAEVRGAKGGSSNRPELIPASYFRSRSDSDNARVG
jgi:hypothetical protein